MIENCADMVQRIFGLELSEENATHCIKQLLKEFIDLREYKVRVVVDSLRGFDGHFVRENVNRHIREKMADDIAERTTVESFMESQDPQDPQMVLFSARSYFLKPERIKELGL